MRSKSQVRRSIEGTPLVTLRYGMTKMTPVAVSVPSDLERATPHVVNCRIARPLRAIAKRVTQRCGPVRTRLER